MSNMKSPNWKTTAASLKLSEKLELSEDGLKVTFEDSFLFEAHNQLLGWHFPNLLWTESTKNQLKNPFEKL